MPSDCTPRISDAASGGGVSRLPCPPRASCAPTVARAAFIPRFTLGAPHTTLNLPAAPASTSHTESRSALGCLPTLTTLATITPEKRGSMRSIDSTSIPAAVRRRDNSAMSASIATNSLSQLSGSFIQATLTQATLTRRVAS